MGSKDHRGLRSWPVLGVGPATLLSPQADGTSYFPRSTSLTIATPCLTLPTMAPQCTQGKGLFPTMPQGASGSDPCPSSSIYTLLRTPPSFALVSSRPCPCPLSCQLFLLPSLYASLLTPIVIQVSMEMPPPPGSLPGPQNSCSQPSWYFRHRSTEYTAGTQSISITWTNSCQIAPSLAPCSPLFPDLNLGMPPRPSLLSHASLVSPLPALPWSLVHNTTILCFCYIFYSRQAATADTMSTPKPVVQMELWCPEPRGHILLQVLTWFVCVRCGFLLHSCPTYTLGPHSGDFRL